VDLIGEVAGRVRALVRLEEDHRPPAGGRVQQELEQLEQAPVRVAHLADELLPQGP
jgi:hypothetical protein